MFETLKNAWRNAELRKKLLYTLFILFIFRLGASIPVPFINRELLANYFATLDAAGGMLSYINVFTGGGLANATLFAMSITPYINASIILQLLTVAIPALENMVKEGGEEGRKKIASWTRYLAVVLCDSGLLLLRDAAQCWTADPDRRLGGHRDRSDVYRRYCADYVAGRTYHPERRWQWYLDHLVRGHRFPRSALANSLLGLIQGGARGALLAVLMVIIGLALVVFIVYMSNAERRIPIQYAKRVVGRKMYGGQSTFLPIKVNATGVMPIIFASSILSLPATVFMFYTPQAGSIGSVIKDLFSQDNPFYIVLYAILIIAFSYFYASIQFNPVEIANNLKKNGGFIPGFRPGKPTADFITKALAKVVFVGALFLGVVALLPLIVGAFSTSLSNVAVGGTSVIIVVGVALETVKQIEAQLMMRHHKGFLE